MATATPKRSADEEFEETLKENDAELPDELSMLAKDESTGKELNIYLYFYPFLNLHFTRSLWHIPG